MEGRTSSGDVLFNLYGVPGGQRFTGTGVVDLGGLNPNGFTAYARNSIPDGGSTVMLMGLALLGLYYFGRRYECR